MRSVERAVWYIETHLGGDLSLDLVADAAGVSKFYLARTFNAHAGQPVMRYVRARRLSEAARRLACGSCGILEVALEAGYNSHEAFTRAFGDQFGVTPDRARRTRSLENIDLTEPLRMNETPATLPEPKITEHGALLLVGLKKRYRDSTSAEIPAQWQAFRPYIGAIDHQLGNAAYGVLFGGEVEDEIDHLTGVEVSHCPDIPRGLDSLRVAPQTYAVFRHDGHVSEIRRTWKAIFGTWLRQSDHRLVAAPKIERYGEGFDPETGVGDIEIWIPVAG